MQTTAFQEELTPLQQLVRACIQGDSSSVLSLLLQLAREENSIDINHSDAEGTPPLCYASCWGHSHIVALLLAAGADVDRCDKNGWTPLMWAAASSHDVITQLLLDHGADPTRTNQKGQKLEEIVRSSSSLSSYSETASVSIEHAVHLENELQQAQREKFIKEKNAFIKSDDEDDGEDDNSDGLTASSHDWMSQTSGTLFSLGRRDREGGDKKTQPVRVLEEDEDGGEDETTSRMPFIWDSPQLDQILVFEERNIHRILHVAITELRPTKLSLGKPIPANIIFLGARYAHYLSSMELLDEFLGEAVKAICKEVKTQGDNVHTLSFWISNCTHLLYYFQKDPSLRLSTFKYQRIFAELVQELYDLTVAFVRGEVLTILDAAVLDFADSEAIPIVSTTVLEKQPPVTVSATSRIKRASWILYKQTNDLFSNAVRAAAKVGSMAIPSSQLYQQQKRFRTVIPSPSANSSLNNRCCHIYGSSTLLNKKEEPNSPSRRTPTQNTPNIPTPPASPTPALPLVPHSLQPTPKKTRYTSKPPTPKTVPQILNNALTSFQLAHIHPSIKQQLLHQILTTINQSLFEGLLNPTRYNRSFTDAWSTRSRAVAIRINLSSLETWIRDNETHISPASMARTTDSGSDTVTEDSQRLEAESFYNSHPLIPTFQLMQYLHVLTSLDSLEAYLRILPSLPHVSFETQKRVLNVYRCEENEEGVCEDVKMYVEEMEIMAKRVKEVEEKEREEKEPGLVLFDLSCSSGLESGDELDDLLQSSAAKTTRLSNSWESKVFPFAVPMFENDRLEREMEEWKEVGRPHVPPLVLRMLDGGSGMTGLDEEEEEDGID